MDLVVGADGAWSKVRTLLTPQLPHYSGITIIELRAANVSTHKPWLSSFVGSGSLFMFDKDRALVCQHNGNDSIRVYVGLQQPETWFRGCGIDWTKQDTARQLLVDRYFRDCGEDIKRVIATEASDGLRTWPLSMLPIGTTWSPRQGVTLLGDAAHLMTPFARVAVNVALVDALDLAKALLKRNDAFEVDVQGPLTDATKDYEGPMFERVKANMEKTWQGLQHHFSKDGIDDRVRNLKGRAKMMEDETRRRREAKGSKGGREMEDKKGKDAVTPPAPPFESVETYKRKYIYIYIYIANKNQVISTFIR